MAEGYGAAGANTALDALTTAYPWVKMHTGAPGSAGTSNAATETTRKQVAVSAASGGATASTGALTWTNVAGSETYSKSSFWTASTSGTFGYSGAVTASAVTAGDTFTVAIGGVTVSLTLAS